jgi:hypothetical protein
LFALALLGCGRPSMSVESNGSGSDASSSASESTTTETSTDTSGSPTFVPVTDMNTTSPCAVIFQDCPPGEKCVPTPNWGDGFFFEAKCVPVIGDQTAGEPCTYAGPEESTDNCDANSGCWDIEIIDGEFVGTCYAFCSTENLECPPQSACLYDFTGYPGYCIPTCDPLLQDCGPGEGCYWVNDSFHCIATTANWALGEPCMFIDDCAPGLVCLPAEYLPACAGSSCCGAWCDLDLGDAPCEVMPGTVCASFFPETPPPGYEGIGVCTLP